MRTLSDTCTGKGSEIMLLVMGRTSAQIAAVDGQ
jgi:hypothetical protein